MRFRLLLTTAVATTALASFGLVPMPTAHAGLPSECFGHDVSIQGTSGDDVISVTVMKSSVSVLIQRLKDGRVTNSRSYELFMFPAIASGGGNDRINFMSLDGGGVGVACTGDGNDVVLGSMLSRISTGSGKDRVEQYLVCGTNPDIYGAERVKITGFDSGAVGPCRGL